MSRALPPLDLHAHVAIDIAPRALEGLGAVVFAVTRSLDESEEVCRRSDAVTVWGVGCHPGVMSAQENYDEVRFAANLAKTPLVGEVGLDGASRVPIELQVQTFSSVLAVVAKYPRILSVHSYRATARVLDLIEQAGVEGAVLHWWLGSQAETRRALDLGCFFSINQSMNPDKLRLAGVPITSLLPETDHPSGNRRGEVPRQPGCTFDVERAVASAYRVPIAEVRDQFWVTFAELAHATRVTSLLPPAVQAMVSYAQNLDLTPGQRPPEPRTRER